MRNLPCSRVILLTVSMSAMDLGAIWGARKRLARSSFKRATIAARITYYPGLAHGISIPGLTSRKIWRNGLDLT